MNNNNEWMTLKKLVKDKVKLENDSFERIWNNIILEFEPWFDSVANMTSKLTIKLELLRRICEGFQKYNLKDDISIKTLILEEALPVGKTITLDNSNDLKHIFNVVDREISDNFMVRYILRSNDGTMITREYVD